jgi:16S rRNA (adenine1518-N6/adenine1519-N6)-dimethyltransferase
MVDALDLVEVDTVVEIGPGLGVLTNELVHKLLDTISIIAIDIDKRFVENLKVVYLNSLNVQIVEADILDWLPNYKPEKPFKVLGSLPYYITSPIIHSIIKMQKLPEKCVLMIQKEVAEKVAAKAPDASYLSTFAQTFYDIEYLGKVDKDKFKPAPKVDGGIIKMTLRHDAPIQVENIKSYEGFLHKGFASPRKMLNKVFTKEQLAKANLNGNLRPQNLDANMWAEVFKSVGYNA